MIYSPLSFFHYNFCSYPRLAGHGACFSSEILYWRCCFLWAGSGCCGNTTASKFSILKSFTGIWKRLQLQIQVCWLIGASRTSAVASKLCIGLSYQRGCNKMFTYHMSHVTSLCMLLLTVWGDVQVLQSIKVKPVISPPFWATYSFNLWPKN